jgi:hypothetical protein
MVNNFFNSGSAVCKWKGMQKTVNKYISRDCCTSNDKSFMVEEFLGSICCLGKKYAGEYSKQNTSFWKWDLFSSSGEKVVSAYSAVSIIASHSHWTARQTQLRR